MHFFALSFELDFELDFELELGVGNDQFLILDTFRIIKI